MLFAGVEAANRAEDLLLPVHHVLLPGAAVRGPGEDGREAGLLRGQSRQAARLSQDDQGNQWGCCCLFVC